MIPLISSFHKKGGSIFGISFSSNGAQLLFMAHEKIGIKGKEAFLLDMCIVNNVMMG